MSSDTYKVAYEREKLARIRAEDLLDKKTRTLYDSVLKLQETVSELEQMQDKLVQSEKMASIGQLAAGVAHEINNPIGFSLSNLTTLSEYIASFIKLDSLVLENISDSVSADFINQYNALRKDEDIDFIVDDLGGLLGDTVKGLNRVSAIVSNLKKVSHAGELEKELCDVNEIIEESIKVVWSELKYNMEVEKKFGDIPHIYCHTGEIHQVLMNLFLNASHACKDKGILRLSTAIQKIKEKEWLVIRVADNGDGMPMEVKKKIFDPFFTTKPVGVGTGLGLSVSFGIIDKHKGTIEVHSEEGLGTTFIICLPLPDDSAGTSIS